MPVGRKGRARANEMRAADESPQKPSKKRSVAVGRRRLPQGGTEKILTKAPVGDDEFKVLDLPELKVLDDPLKGSFLLPGLDDTPGKMMTNYFSHVENRALLDDEEFVLKLKTIFNQSKRKEDHSSVDAAEKDVVVSSNTLDLKPEPDAKQESDVKRVKPKPDVKPEEGEVIKVKIEKGLETTEVGKKKKKPDAIKFAHEAMLLDIFKKSFFSLGPFLPAAKIFSAIKTLFGKHFFYSQAQKDLGIKSMSRLLVNENEDIVEIYYENLRAYASKEDLNLYLNSIYSAKSTYFSSKFSSVKSSQVDAIKKLARSKLFLTEENINEWRKKTEAYSQFDYKSETDANLKLCYHSCEELDFTDAHQADRAFSEEFFDVFSQLVVSNSFSAKHGFIATKWAKKSRGYNAFVATVLENLVMGLNNDKIESVDKFKLWKAFFIRKLNSKKKSLVLNAEVEVLHDDFEDFDELD